jgi:hypothetical protein
MTLQAKRDGQNITLTGNIGLDVEIRNSGVSNFAVTENAQHVRHVWARLGKLLDEADAERNDNA